MSSIFRFPDALAIKESLCRHSLLNDDFFIVSGITERVAILAAERFANKNMSEIKIQKHVTLIVCALRSGECGGIFNVDLRDIYWVAFSVFIEQALIDCAKNHLINSSIG